MYSPLRLIVKTADLTLALLLASVRPAAADPPPFAAHLGRCDAELTRLFTPSPPVRGAYAVCTIPAPLAVVAPPGWRVEALEPLDAFGTAGAYDRSRLTRLYGGRRARVARGWDREGDVFTAWTLVSPYPDAALAHLIDGTLVVRWQCTMHNAECR